MTHPTPSVRAIHPGHPIRAGAAAAPSHVVTEHASMAMSERDPALVERAALLIELVRIETAALRDRLDAANLVDAVTLAEVDRLLGQTDRIEAMIRSSAMPRDRRALADATTSLRAQWNSFQFRRSVAIRTG